jgi:hypothetical protein
MLLSRLTSRNQLGEFLSERDLTTSGVELGTHRGDYAATLLESWPGKLYCVDPWENPPEYAWQATFLPGRGHDREGDYRAALRALARFGDRVALCRTLSAEAVEDFLDESLDFVYVDANHERPHVDEDLHLWYPKLRPGGVLAGHDFICPGESDGGWGKHIQPAVLEFAATYGLDVHLIPEERWLPWSYYVIKPKDS